MRATAAVASFVTTSALFTAAPTLAQGNPPPAVPAENVPVAIKGPSTDQPPISGDQIVVTAQRRTERLVDVPIAITQATGEQLRRAGIETVSALPQIAPALRFDLSGAYVQPTIRGVGSPLAGPGLNSNVAVYVDGFYVPNALGTDFQLLNVDNVQVLKGPQGTLFGRNATGGAVLINTRAPSFHPTGTARVTYASFDKLNISAYGSTALTRNVAFDVSGYLERGDGYVRNLNTGNEDGRYRRSAIRTKLLWQLTDDVAFTLAYGHSYIDDPTGLVGSLYEGLTAGNQIAGIPIASKPRETSNGFVVQNKFKGDSLSLTGKMNLGFATLTSLTQYRNERSSEIQEYDGVIAPIFSPAYRINDRTVTQEFNLASGKTGPLSYVLGLYYYHNENEYPDVAVAAGGAPYTVFYSTEVRSNSYAAFADLTYKLTDRLFLTGGLRYSIDELFGRYDATPIGLGTNSGRARFKALTPRAIARYEFDTDSNVYASYNRGYKAGVLPIASFSFTPVDPEHIDAYEVGFKTARGPIRFDAAAYYYDYAGLQAASFVGFGSIVRNAASSKIYGLDGQLAVRVTDSFDVNVGAAYNHAHYRSFPTAIAYQQDLNPASPTYSLFNTVNVDASGNVMPRAPKVTANAGMHYRRSVGRGRLDLTANVYHTSSFFFDSVEQFGQKAYTLVNLRAAYTLPGDRVEVAIFGTNVTNAKYRTQVYPNTFAVQQTFGEPAAIGVGLTLRR